MKQHNGKFLTLMALALAVGCAALIGLSRGQRIPAA